MNRDIPIYLMCVVLFNDICKNIARACPILYNIVQGLISTIMNAAGFGTAQQTVLPSEIVTAVEDCGFFESIPLWAVTLIGGMFITVLSFIMIMMVYYYILQK